MRPPAKYRHSETSYISRYDHFAAMANYDIIITP